MKSDQTEFMCFNQYVTTSLKLVDQFIYLGSNISSTESNVNICICKAGFAIDRLLTT